MDKLIARRMWLNTSPLMEPVTLRVRAGGSTSSFTAYSLPRAKRRPSTNQVSGEFAANELTCRWELWNESLLAASAPNPKITDEVMDANGVKWVITRITNNMLEEVFVCDCQREVA